MGGRESLAQAFTLLSFLSAGLLGLSSLPMWNQAAEPSSTSPETEAPSESPDTVLPMGVWILSSPLAKPLQSSSRQLADDNDDASTEAAIASSSSTSPRPIRANANLDRASASPSEVRTASVLPSLTSSSGETSQTTSNRTALDLLPAEARRDASSEGSDSPPSSGSVASSQAAGDRLNNRRDFSQAITRERSAPAPAAPIVNREIIVDLSDRQVSLYQNSQLRYLFPIAIGRVGWETPVGQFEVIEKQTNPVWQNPITDEIVESGPNNPLGARWIGFWSDGKNQLGFHGTNQNELIGQAVSHGCIRMRNEDIERLYEEAAMGTPIRIQP